MYSKCSGFSLIASSTASVHTFTYGGQAYCLDASMLDSITFLILKNDVKWSIACGCGSVHLNINSIYILGY